MQKTSDLLGYHISVFNFFGVWRSKDKVKDLKFSFRTGIFLFCLAPLTIASMLYASFRETRFTDVIISPLYTVNTILVLFKAVNFYIKTPKIENFLIHIDKVPFFNETREKDTKHSTIRRIRLLPITLGFLLISLAFIILLTPVVLGTITTTRALPTWYPFEWEGKFGLCFVLFIFEFVAGFTFIILALATDSFLGCTLLIIGGQLDSLGYRLKNLPANNATVWLIKFKKCVQEYNSIYKLSKEFENTFSGIIFTQALLSCFLICLSAFALSLANNISTFLQYSAFLLSMLYEVFLTCYAGDYLTEKSEKLLFDLYSSSWPDIPQNCRKMVLMLSLKLNNPIVIKFGVIQYLLLKTFTKIVDAAYKLYALLQQVPE